MRINTLKTIRVFNFMSDLITNLNGAPYYDDYDKAKSYYRILWIPSRAVQTREINQEQAIFQEQIRRFANHIFKDGSIVDGCNINHVPEMAYVRLVNGWDESNQNVAFDDHLHGFLVVSTATGVRASIRLVKQGYEAQYPNTNTFYLDYIKTGRDAADEEVDTFLSGETLTLYRADQEKLAETLDPSKIYNTIKVITKTPANGREPTGATYAVSVGEGIVYQKGFFVSVKPHTITVKDYDTAVENWMVGFDTRESIVTYLQDQSLLDPVAGESQNAIGADRLKLEPVLISKYKEDITEQDDFFPIIEFGEKSPYVQKTDPEYARLGDYIGTGIYEPHGDFYVKPMITSSTIDNANTANFRFAVGAGISYVKGNRVELIATKHLTAPRAIVTEESNAAITTINYGNYVLVREMLGLFNYDQLAVIDLYSSAQEAVSKIQNVTSPAVGTKIGTANVRGLVYESGRKGTGEATYRLYITNIRMNNGRSFSDVKGMIATSSIGSAKADVVLEGGRAMIKDSARNSLVFNTGIEGMRRFRDAQGSNDTQFYIRDISTATLQANGVVTFTLNTPHAGGLERFFASNGQLSSVNELRIDAVTSNALETAPKTGTVSFTTGSANVIGVGTSFTTEYVVGDNIKAGAAIGKIKTITNNTHAVLIGNSGATVAASPHSKFYQAGAVIDLSSSTTVVNVISNTQFTVTMGENYAVGAPQTLTASYPVMRTQAVEMKKTVQRNLYVKIDVTAANVNSGVWNLGLTDVYGISGVFVGNSFLETNPDRSEWFSLDSGQTESFYDHAKLVLKPKYRGKVTAGMKILVRLNRFNSDSLSGIGFYSVDSYPTRSPTQAANTTNISYADIPTFRGDDLRACVDFRPSKMNSANSATTIATATTNPAVSNNSFIVTTSGTYIAEPDTNFQADVEYYLPRIDLVQVNKDGRFNVKSSVAQLKPLTPKTDHDSMPIATAFIPPFPSLTQDETTGSSASKISPKLAGNRAYTEKDVYGLDQRINRLEYYQTLSMLEAQAKDMNITDENGMSRFKNGIFADPMKNHLLGDVSNFEYSISIDAMNEIARPKTEVNDFDLKIGDRVNTTVFGSSLTLPYSSKMFIQQEYGSKYRNVTESVWNWTGSLDLFPSYDHFRDEKITPDVTVEIDLASQWEQFAESPFGTMYGDWRMTDSRVTGSSSRTTSSRTNGGTMSNTTTTTNILETYEREVTNLHVGTSTTNYDLGSYVSDFTINPFMRSREVAFIVNGLKPNTKYWAFFDKEPVSNVCAPAKLSPEFDANSNSFLAVEGKESDIVVRSGDWGTQLLTDSTGTLYGIFKIPEGKFRVGDREFIVANVDSLATGKDAITSSARAIYTASAMTITKNGINLTTVDPILTTSTGSDTEVRSSQRVTTSSSFRQDREQGEGGGRGDGDPLGQSFLVDTDGAASGMYLDKIGVYFKTKDPTLGITMYISEMQAGFPDSSRTLSKAYLKPSEIKVSEDGSLETVFKFNNMPYLTNGNYYAFFLKPDGDSPEYLIYTAEIGGVDLVSGKKIYSNPNIGVMFVSANANTWTAIQTEDVKFNVYRAKFETLSGTCEFVDQDDEYFSVSGFTMANTQNMIQIGDVVYAQNSSGGVMTGNTAPYGVVQYYDYAEDMLELDSSTGGFKAGMTLQIHRPTQAANSAAISTTSLVATTKINEVRDYDYSTVVSRFATITPFGTDVSIKFKGMDIAENYDTTWINIQPEMEREYIDRMRYIKSKSNRIGIDYSAKFQLTLNSNSDFISPIVDLRRRSALIIKNIINDDVTGEETRYGNALVKYLSQPIVLAEGQDAEDLRVYVTGYRPAGTEIHVYAKLLNAEDPAQFYDKLWTKLDMAAGGAVNSSTLDVNDYREFEYVVPTAEVMQGTAWINANNNGIVQYRDETGAVYESYKSWAIKIVLTSDRAERVPRVQDVRAIALQI